MKHCNKCKIEKDESNFSKNLSRKDGLQNRCKECRAEYRRNSKDIAKLYYERNKNRVILFTNLNNTTYGKQFIKIFRDINKR